MSVLCVGLACQQERPRAGGTLDTSTTGPLDPAGGTGGGGGTGPGTGHGGEAGEGEAGAPGATGQTSIPPMPSCLEQVAFTAVASAFVSPTPKSLALALNELTFDAGPISVVLDGATEQPMVTASYSTVENGVHRFPAELVPSPTPAWILGNAFGSSTAQREGWLLVILEHGPLEVPLRNIHVDVTTEADCTSGFASLTAVIPAETNDIIDDLIGSTDEQPAGERFEGDVTVRGMFVLELVEFDNPI
jgi:hypothetical protein